MSLNRYRLRHRAQHDRGARYASGLLERPERLIGLILLGNNLVNIMAAQLVTLIALRFNHEAAIAIGGLIFTLVVLIFAEVTPKTLAATHPERIAYPAAYVYRPLLRVTWPMVWLVNGAATLVLRVLRLKDLDSEGDALSREELRTVVAEAGALLPKKRQRMLLSILDLEQVRVEDIMVPRNAIVGIDLNADWSVICRELADAEHTRLPVFRDSVDDIVGFIHARKAFQALLAGDLQTSEQVAALAREPYFIPESTPLNRQLVNFQRERRRVGLVVDEYGDIHGLVALDDILEEIVGEYTTDPATRRRGIIEENDGSMVLRGSSNIRRLNRSLGLELPTDGARTLNGMITDYLESMPVAGLSLKINGYPIEILRMRGHTIRSVRIQPRLVEPESDGAL